MIYKVTKYIVIFCCVISFVFFEISIAISNDESSSISDLEKSIENEVESEIAGTAKRLVMRELKEIKSSLADGGWDIDEKSGKLISVSDEVKAKIADIQEKIKTIFLVAARRIEQNKTVAITVKDSGIGIPQSQKERSKKHAEARKSSNISINSRIIALKILYGTNRDLINFAEREENLQKKRDWYLTQAIFAYELGSVVIQMIDTLSTHDIVALREVHKEEMKVLADLEEYYQSLAKGDDKKTKHHAEGALQALEYSRKRWDYELQRIGKKDDWITDLKAQRKTFEEFIILVVNQVKLISLGSTLDKITERMDAITTVLKLDVPDILYVDDALFSAPMSGDIETATKINK